MDTLTPAQRSERMARIRSQNTKLELLIRKALYAKGYRYRLHAKDLPGKPDMVFRSKRIAVFINGCYWHGHQCSIGHIPKSNSEFWRDKIGKNRTRDAVAIRKLRSMGWKVLNIWECQASTASRLEARLDRIENVLRHWNRKFLN